MKVAFIGGGNMAAALIGGMKRAGAGLLSSVVTGFSLFAASGPAHWLFIRGRRVIAQWIRRRTRQGLTSTGTLF